MGKEWLSDKVIEGMNEAISIITCLQTKHVEYSLLIR